MEKQTTSQNCPWLRQFFFLLLNRRIHRNPWLVKEHLSSQSDQTDISKQSLLQSRDICLLCVGGINKVKTNDLEKKRKCAMSVDNRLTSSTRAPEDLGIKLKAILSPLLTTPSTRVSI